MKSFSMKKKLIWLALPLIFVACNNETKDSTEKADSTNTANRDSAIGENKTVIDEGSSSFLVKAADGGMTEVQLAQLAQQKAASQRVKDFSSMMVRDHSDANDKVKALASQKNVVLPTSISDDNQKAIDNMSKKTGKEFDKAFMSKMVDDHQSTIDMFQKAINNAKDPDVSSFADKTLMTLRMHLDSAKAVRSSLK